MVSRELSAPGDDYIVALNTAEAGAAGSFTGPHRVGSRIRVAGGQREGEPVFVSIQPLPPAEVVVLVKA